ncbi:MAG: HTH domain-containing protein, partial [Phycisphaeraceae bacterium]
AGRSRARGVWPRNSRDKATGILPTRRCAVIIDEAHSSQSGETSTELKAVLGGEELARKARDMAAADGAEEMEDPMRCKDIVDLVVKRQLWTPGKGKTPASTLYASILRELTTKGDACRFVKTERGKFALKDSLYIREQAAKAVSRV